MSLLSVALEDRYAAVQGPVLMSGIQALVRLVLEQRRLPPNRVNSNSTRWALGAVTNLVRYWRTRWRWRRRRLGQRVTSSTTTTWALFCGWRPLRTSLITAHTASAAAQFASDAGCCVVMYRRRSTAAPPCAWAECRFASAPGPGPLDFPSRRAVFVPWKPSRRRVRNGKRDFLLRNQCCRRGCTSRRNPPGTFWSRTLGDLRVITRCSDPTR